MFGSTSESGLRWMATAACMLLALFSFPATPAGACTYLGEIFSGKTDLGKLGGHVNVDITTQPGCDIPQEIPEPWVTVKLLRTDTKKSKLGGQTQNVMIAHYLVNVLLNKTSSPRSQRIKFGDFSFTVSQAETLNP